VRKGLISTLVWGAILIPILGFVFGLRSLKQNIRNEIQTIESLSFATDGIRIGKCVAAFFIGFIVSLMLAILLQISGDEFLTFVWSVTMSSLLIVTIWSGLKVKIIEAKTIPNQGIHLSLKSATFAGLIFALPSGLCVIIGGAFIDEFAKLSNIALALVLFVSIFATLSFGAVNVIQHYFLRFILYCKEYIPWNYTRFLDHAVSFIFLQKVGGGYIFIHRLLLEHFADRPLQSKTQKK
jgi:hypothetical protein